MRHRRPARERAVQFLFQHDLNLPENPERRWINFGLPTTAALEEDMKPATWAGDRTPRPPRRTMKFGWLRRSLIRRTGSPKGNRRNDR